MEASFVNKRIAELLTLWNLSESQVSAGLGKSHGYLQSITSGNSLPSMKQFFNICDYFGITPAQFFKEDGADSPLIIELLELLRRLPERDVRMLLNHARRLDDLNRRLENR